MTKPSRHGKAHGATIAVIGAGLLLALLAGVITTGIIWSRRIEIPKDADGLTESEVTELTRKLQATIADAEALTATTQPAATLPADPKVEQLKGELGALSDRAAKLVARLEKALESSTQPATSPATSAASFPTTPETQPTFPLTPPKEPTSQAVNKSTSGAGK
ncbi:MAG: hypothetical protein ISS78_01800 [Phycisphaerae bacterium]|nr:hypothetical protein [Phycisphaerae bacterium]